MEIGVEAESASDGTAVAVEVVRDVFAMSVRRGVLLPVILSGCFGVLAFLIVLSFERGNGGGDCHAPCRICDCSHATHDSNSNRRKIAKQPSFCARDSSTLSRPQRSRSQP